MPLHRSPVVSAVWYEPRTRRLECRHCQTNRSEMLRSAERRSNGKRKAVRIESGGHVERTYRQLRSARFQRKVRREPGRIGMSVALDRRAPGTVTSLSPGRIRLLPLWSRVVVATRLSMSGGLSGRRMHETGGPSTWACQSGNEPQANQGGEEPGRMPRNHGFEFRRSGANAGAAWSGPNT